ncbi:MAG: transposase, partial [Candidatus Nitrosopolaris sp.]
SEKIVSFRVTKGNVHDSKKFSPIIREVSKGYDIDKVYADKAHDNRRSFNLLDNLNIEPAIQIRKNAFIKTKRCPLRRDEVLLIRKLEYERWKQLKDTGRRWIAEIAFSSYSFSRGMMKTCSNTGWCPPTEFVEGTICPSFDIRYTSISP